MYIDELQADVPDLTKIAEEIIEYLRNAESCDSKEDFNQNLRGALGAMQSLRFWIQPLLKKGEKCKRYSENQDSSNV